MPLIRCPECSSTISSLADSCPKCGCPSREFTGVSPGGKSIASPSAGKAIPELPFLSDWREFKSMPVPGYWSPSHDAIDIRSIIAIKREGGWRNGTWYVARTNPVGREILSYESEATPSQAKMIIIGAMAGNWFQGFYPKGGGGPTRGWTIKKTLFLRYEHPGFKKEIVVPAQGAGCWIAAIFPGLWHLFSWTSTGLGVGLSFALVSASLQYAMNGSTSYGSPVWDRWGLNAQMLALGSFAVWVAAAVTYYLKATTWRIRNLEKRGFECTGGAVATNKAEAVGMLATQPSPTRGLLKEVFGS